MAEETLRDVDSSGHWPGLIQTRISDAGRFWEAVAEDQDALQRYPGACPFPRAEVRSTDRGTTG